jgi:type I restriction enzyme S subunit
MKKGWEIKKLKDFCEFSNGLWTGKKPPFQRVGVIRNTNFTKNSLLDDTDIVYLDVEQSQFQKRKLQFGDIILEKSGGGPKQPVGRVVVFDKTEGDFSFSNFTSAIKVKDKNKVDFNYLHRYLYFEYISGATERMQSHSTGIRNLKFDEYKEIEVPLPLLLEQQRIVSILDKCFSAIDKAKKNAEQNLRNAKELFESSLQRIFEKKGKGWEEKKLGEIATFSQGIQVGLEHHLLEPKKGYVRFIRIVDYTQNTDDIRYIPDPGEKYFVKEEDIVMVRYGTPGLIGRGKAGVIANNLFKITIEKNDLSNDFLSVCLSQKHIQTYLSSQGSATMPALNFGQLKEVLIHFPSIKEQQTIVRQLDALRAETQKLEAVYQKKIADLEELKKSILQKAFAGELTEKNIAV